MVIHFGNVSPHTCLIPLISSAKLFLTQYFKPLTSPLWTEDRGVVGVDWGVLQSGFCSERSEIPGGFETDLEGEDSQDVCWWFIFYCSIILPLHRAITHILTGTHIHTPHKYARMHTHTHTAFSLYCQASCTSGTNCFQKRDLVIQVFVLACEKSEWDT